MSKSPTFLAPTQGALRVRPNTNLPVVSVSASDAAAPTSAPAGTRFSTGEDLYLLDGPSSAPGGAVTVDPATTALNTATSANPAGTTFYLLAGTHILGGGSPSAFDQVIPKNGNTYVGAPGARLDGRSINQYAFTSSATNVTIRYLEVVNFVTPFDEFCVNHDTASNWLIEYCNFHNNGGAACGAGSNCTIQYSWLHHNRQYAFSCYKNPSGLATTPAISNVTVDHCEIHNNGDPRDEYQPNGTPTYFGRNGGCKFWDTDTPVMTNNWIHHSHLVAIWADTNNIRMRVEGNLIEDNFGQGFFYEISYNFRVASNMFRRNAIGDGLRGNYLTDNFPTGAIYISESGSESRVTGLYASSSEIRSNAFVNNWDDVVLWENSDRFCNSPANTSGKIWKPLGGAASLAACNNPTPRVLTVTLTSGSPNFTVTAGTFEYTDEGELVSGTGIPAGAKILEGQESNGFDGGYVSASSGIMDQNATSSGSVTMTILGGTIDVNPAYYDCRWHTQNIDVHHNTFDHNRSEVLGAKNSLSGGVITGKHALIAQFGSFPSWSPYQANAIVNVMFSQGNSWRSNAYRGNYSWMGPDTSQQWTFAQWQASPRLMDTTSTNSTTPPTGGGGGDVYKPDPPTSVAGVAGNAQVRVSFTPPADAGGQIVTGYLVTSSPGGITASALAGPITVPGLTNTTAYTFTVQTRTAIGDSIASSASGSVTPTIGSSFSATTVPWHSEYVTARKRTSTTAEVSFSVPSSDGGATITGYTVTSSPGGLTGTGSSSPITVSGLTPGTPYTFTVTATNSVGTGPSSKASIAITP